MVINKIKITNFKSFNEFETELGRFNVLIGANASGKTNFVQVFKFLKDIKNFGLDNAISMQGGVEYLRNVNIGPSKNLLIEAVSPQKYSWGIRKNGDNFTAINSYETTYRFALKFGKETNYKVAEDKIIHKCDLVRLTEQKENIEEKELLWRGDIIVSNIGGKISVTISPENEQIKDNISLSFLEGINLKDKILLELVSFFPVPSTFDNDISIYDFYPKSPKTATLITGKSNLEEDGSNLAIVLKNILANKEKERKFFNLVKDLLPFVEKLDVEKFADKSLLFKLRETYYNKQYLPALLVSDGTINIVALIIALYFDESPLTVIEEPERNIHPYLISKVVEMIKDASQKKQIIVTTHNPEMVKYAGVENILIASRDKDGFSVISRPLEKENIKTFLKNELGIEELFISNLLV